LGCWWGTREILGPSMGPAMSASAAIFFSALSFLAPPAAAPALSLLAATTAGATLGTITASSRPARILEEHHRGLAAMWQVRGKLATDPEGADDAAIVELSIAQVRIDGEWRPWQARLGVTIYERPPAATWRAGDRFEAFLRLREDRPPANPGSWARNRLRARGLDLRSSLKSFDQLRPRGRPPPYAPQRWTAELRRILRSHIERRFPRYEAVIRALLLGERAGLDGQMTAALARAGLIHLLAISGLHVGLALGAAYALGRASGLPRPGAALIAGVVLLGIVAIVVARAPVLRAALMASASLAAVVAGRRSAPLNGWALAVFCLTLHNPLSVRDFGFQLSAAATLGILLMVPAINAQLKASETSPQKLGGYLRALVLTSFAAQVSVAPFLAAHTHRIPLGGLLLNLAAIPMLAMTLAAACLVLMISVLDLFWLGGATLAASTEAGVRVLLAIADLAELSPMASLVVPAGRSALLVGMAFFILVSIYRRGWARTGALAVATAFLALAAWPAAAPEHTRFVALDVGQGDALLLWPAGDDPILIDSGGSPGGDFDTGTAIVAPALRGLGVSRLQAVVISHLHADHAGGIPGLLREIPAAEIWASSLPVDLPLASEIRDAGRASLIRMVSAGNRGDLASCRWRALHPQAAGERDHPPQNLNDSSLVLGLHCGPRHLLLPGDSEESAERTWGPSAGPFARGVLKVAHHGSRTSSSAPLLERLAPRVALISVGWRNRFGFPHKPVLERLRAGGTAVYRTDRDGAITVELGRRITVRGERWTSGVR